jgi:ABC-type transport system substrate-binding protein
VGTLTNGKGRRAESGDQGRGNPGRLRIGRTPENYTNSIMGILASRVNSFISKESFEMNGEEWAMSNPVGTGPFKFKEKVSGYHVYLVRNENYWQKGLPYLDGIELRRADG